MVEAATKHTFRYEVSVILPDNCRAKDRELTEEQKVAILCHFQALVGYEIVVALMEISDEFVASMGETVAKYQLVLAAAESGEITNFVRDVVRKNIGHGLLLETTNRKPVKLIK